MSFEKEKELSKKLRDLKKNLDSMEELQDTMQKSRQLRKIIDTDRKSTSKLHMELQENATKSQKLHEDIISKSKEIDELRKKEKESYANFSKEKKVFVELNQQLKEKLKKMGPQPASALRERKAVPAALPQLEGSRRRGREGQRVWKERGAVAWMACGFSARPENKKPPGEPGGFESCKAGCKRVGLGSFPVS